MVEVVVSKDTRYLELLSMTGKAEKSVCSLWFCPCSSRLIGANQLLGNNRFKWTKTQQLYLLNQFSINRFLKLKLQIAASQCQDLLEGAQHQEKEQTQKFQGWNSSQFIIFGGKSLGDCRAGQRLSGVLDLISRVSSTLNFMLAS